MLNFHPIFSFFQLFFNFFFMAEKWAWNKNSVRASSIQYLEGYFDRKTGHHSVAGLSLCLSLCRPVSLSIFVFLSLSFYLCLCIFVFVSLSTTTTTTVKWRSEKILYHRSSLTDICWKFFFNFLQGPAPSDVRQPVTFTVFVSLSPCVRLSPSVGLFIVLPTICRD